jgi:hypothetical protein
MSLPYLHLLRAVGDNMQMKLHIAPALCIASNAIHVLQAIHA